MKQRSLLPVLVLLLTIGLAATKLSAAEITGYALVQEDGSLRVDGRTVLLFGIYVPETARSCRTFERPILCSSRAALALDFKIGTEFVHCEPRLRNDDGSVIALCRARGEDLSAYLLERGWALALPDAPFEYIALEKIANRKGVGVWGFPLDRRR